MKKTIIGAFCALMLCLIALPVTARAEEPQNHTDHNGWIALTKEYYDTNKNEEGSFFLTAGNYYLAEDLTATISINIMSGNDVTLCLNGHVLTFEGSRLQLPIGDARTLTLCDCQSEKTTCGNIDETGLWKKADSSGNCDLTGGVITGGGENGVYLQNGTFNMYGGNIAGNAQGVEVEFRGTFNMYGGSIIGNANSEDGGGVNITSSGAFHMYGGRITRNSAANGGGVYVGGGDCNITVSIDENTATNGGGVYVGGGECSITGSISGNTAENGGGVYVGGGECTLTGSISGNTATSSPISGGGGVYVGGGSFCIAGGRVNSNRAEYYGGGVYVREKGGGTFKMTGGSVSDNWAQYFGGGIELRSGSHTISGGSITGNQTGNKNSGDSPPAGGGICVDYAVQLTLSEDVKISDNSSVRGGGVYVNEKTLSLSGSVVFSDNTGGDIYLRNLTADSTTAIRLTSQLTLPVGNGQKISLSMEKPGVFVTNWKETMGEADPAEYFDCNAVSGYHSGVNANGAAYLLANQYTVHFKANGGTGSMSNQPFTYDQAQNLAQNAFTRTGYTFAGWRGSDGENYTDGQNVSNLTAENDGTFTLTAQWTAHTYTVTFDPGEGGSGSMSAQTFTYDTELALTPNAFTKTGYHFTGWSTTPEGSVVYTNGQQVRNLTEVNNGTFTLYAQWTAHTYTVTFDPGEGGSGSMSAQPFTYDVRQALIANGFTRTGYTFAGWHGSDGKNYADQEEVLNLTAENDGTVILTAQWTVNSYAITLHPNEGEIEGKTPRSDGWYAIDYTYGVGTVLPTEKEITRSGYRFGGWYDNEALKGEPVTEISATDINDKEYWAKWDPIPSAASYGITLEDTDHGSVKSSHRSASRGTTVTLTIAADDDCRLAFLTAADSKGSRIALTGKGDGKFTFQMPDSKVTVKAVFAPASLPFADVPETAWYYDAVWYAYAGGLMNGTSATTFAPHATTSRAMIVTILWRLAGSPVVDYAMDFEDVNQGQWYSEAIRWAASEGIAGGHGDGSFGTNDPVTREQLAAMLYRYARSAGADVSIGENTNILSYTDAADVSEWAVPAMQWACGAGILQGDAGALKPRDSATRAETAAMLQRFCGYPVP